MFINDIESLLRNSGEIIAPVGDYYLKLNLENPHERRYAACFVADIKYPTLDVDRFLIEKFVRPGDTVLDAGANIGLTALLFVKAGASQVVAFEPVPALAERVRAIQCPLIQCEQQALSSERGEATLYLSLAHNQGSTSDHDTIAMFPQVYGDEKQSMNVKTMPLDDVNLKFDIWKIDIEGAEIDAIDGASRHLEEFPPRVIIAELYGDKYEKFFSRINHKYKFAYRACIRMDDYSLCLIDPSDYDRQAEMFHTFAPTFVFLQTSIDDIAIDK